MLWLLFVRFSFYVGQFWKTERSPKPNNKNATYKVVQVTRAVPAVQIGARRPISWTSLVSSIAVYCKRWYLPMPAPFWKTDALQFWTLLDQYVLMFTFHHVTEGGHYRKIWIFLWVRNAKIAKMPSFYKQQTQCCPNFGIKFWVITCLNVFLPFTGKNQNPYYELPFLASP